MIHHYFLLFDAPEWLDVVQEWGLGSAYYTD
jgi:hypothetical protein